MNITSLASLKKALPVGARFFCLAHHRQPKLVNTYRTVCKVQGNGVYYLVDGGDGKRMWLEWPAAAKMTFAADRFTISFWPGEPALEYQVLETVAAPAQIAA